jgi:hypothetical protein
LFLPGLSIREQDGTVLNNSAYLLDVSGSYPSSATPHLGMCRKEDNDAFSDSGLVEALL